MDVHAAIAKVEGSEAFKGFSAKEKGAYLVHAFSMHSAGGEPEWQIGYYLPEREKLVVFKAEPLERMPEDEAFNKGEPIKRLDMEKVKITPEEAEQRALALKEERFPAETVTKVILLLQRLETQLYNLTLVTSTFNILNVRVDAASGEVLASAFRSIMSLRQSEEEKG